MIICQPDKAHNLYYNLDIQIFPSYHHIKGNVRIENPPANCFYLNKDFKISRIIANEKALAYSVLPEQDLPLTTGCALCVEGELPDALTIEYTGTIDYIINAVNVIQTDLVELALYAAWFPIFGNNIEFEYVLHVTLPSGNLTTTNGIMLHQELNEDRITTIWKSIGPCSDIVIISSPNFKAISEEQQGTQIELFYDKMPTSTIIHQKNALVNAINRLVHLYGPTHTSGMLRYVTSPRDGWGYSRVPLFVAPESYMLSQLNEAWGSAMNFHGAAHELAHFWWLIADTLTPDDWINEGLAEYSAFRLSEEFYGEDFAKILIDEYRQHISQCTTETSIADTPNTSEDRYVNRYEKTTLIYIEARKRYGQENLDSVLQSLFAKYDHSRGATTALFLEEIHDHIGSEAMTYFKTALYQSEWIDPRYLP